jgi:hypothetical protein
MWKANHASSGDAANANENENENANANEDTSGKNQEPNSRTMIRPDSGSLMTPQRVAQLLVRTMVANHYYYAISRCFFYEVWITKASGLLYGTMSHYTPTLFYWVNHFVGLARMEAYKVQQMDMLEIPALVQTLLQVLRRKISTVLLHQ